QTTGMPASVSASGPSSSPCLTASWSGVYGSLTTWASGSGASPRPRVRFAYRMWKPPDPSPRSRDWTLTSTSSPSAAGPVSRGNARHGSPSTSRRTHPSFRSTTDVTVPRRRLSATAALGGRCARGVHERECDVDHALEVGDADLLGRGVDVRHPIREVEASETPLVEDVCVR